MLPDRNEHMQTFENEGVTFIFPENLGHLKAVPIGYPKVWPDDKENNIFKPLGYVMNFKIVSINPKKGVKDEDTCTMEVKYKQKHVDSATQQDKTLQLGIAYENEPWGNMTNAGEITQYEDYRGEWKGKIDIPLENLSKDPVVAWGP